MFKRFTLFCIIIFCLNTVASAQISMNDSTTIKVDISEKKSGAFYYTDDNDVTNPPFRLFSKDKIKKLLIKEPTLLIDAYHQIPFLIYPGEDLTLQIDQSGIPILIDNADSKRTNELNTFVAYYKNLKSSVKAILFYLPKPKSLKNAADFQNLIAIAKSDSVKRLAFLNDYFKSTQTSPEFASYAYRFFKYLYVVNVLNPVYYRGVNVAQLPASYTQYIDSLRSGLNCDGCLSNGGYKSAVVAMQRYLFRNIRADDSRFLAYYDTTSASFSGATRRFLLYDLLRTYMPARLGNYNDRLDQFIAEKTDTYSIFLKNQSDLYSRYKPTGNSNKDILDINGKTYSFDDLLAKYKGNVMFIDVWASWCGPCRVKMPAAQKLKASFEGRKIVFLNISVDANPAAWKKAMREEQLDEKFAYLVPDFNKSDMIYHFHIKVIPRYLVIDREGNVIRYRADDPDNPKLITYLNKFIVD